MTAHARNCRPGDYSKIAAALETLRDMPFPATYLDCVHSEMVRMLGAGYMAQQTYVYLAFFGNSADRATFLKIGVAGNVRKRMNGIAGSNPMARLWLYTAAYPTKADALNVEKALLDHMTKDRVHGEWVDLGGGVSLAAAQSIADSLSELAAHKHQPSVPFVPSGL